MKKKFCLVFILVSALQVSAATFYVNSADPAAKETNPGTKGPALGIYPARFGRGRARGYRNCNAGKL